ncbi:MAG: hypothetical protein QM758_22825 [Armatimonas sp.]
MGWSEKNMGLSINVGMLANWLNSKYADEEGIEWMRKQLVRINRALVEAGLPEHHEPESLPEWRGRARLTSFSYSSIHYLRRAVAYARHDPQGFKPLPEGKSPNKDPLIDDELSVYIDSHFICHSDSEGFYVPIDFAEIIYEDVLPGVMLGSSQRALAEVNLAAPLLGITLTDGKLSDEESSKIAQDSEHEKPLWIERQVWLTMHEAFRRSIEQGCLVVFT